jgi:uncharacterized caspase-like protein
VTLLSLLCALASAQAEKRAALVVANATYRHADKLDDPVKLGFDVICGENLDLK